MFSKSECCLCLCFWETAAGNHREQQFVSMSSPVSDERLESKPQGGGNAACKSSILWASY